MPVFILSKIRQYKTIFFNTFYLSIIEFIKLVMPLIALPYIIKVVGVNKYGMIVFAQSVVAYFSIVVNFGIDILAVKRVAENRDRKNEIEKVIGGVLIIKGALFLFMLCLFTLLILIWGEARNHALLFYFAFLACLTEVIFVPWLFQGLEEMSFITFIKSTSILIYVEIHIHFDLCRIAFAADSPGSGLCIYSTASVGKSVGCLHDWISVYVVLERVSCRESGLAVYLDIFQRFFSDVFVPWVGYHQQ